MLSGCVTVYQPLVGLQDPVVVDPKVANLEGVHLLVRCVPGDYLDENDASALCRNLRTVFTNQGARVEIEIANPRGSYRNKQQTSKPELSMEIRSRLVSADNSYGSCLLAALTCTLVPAVTEFSFASDVTVKDADGVLLASDTYSGRFIRYLGVSVWGVNGILDLLIRPDSEKITGDAAEKDFSKDYYGQLTQLAFHAHMRSLVLHNFDQAAKPPVSPVQPK